MLWYERVNRLGELKECFTEFIGDTIFKYIQYISIRNANGSWIVLLGINDLDFETEILNYAPQILLKIKEFQENREDTNRIHKIPKKINIFKYDMEIVKDKKEHQKKVYDWKKNPQKYAISTEKENGFYYENEQLIYVVDSVYFIVKNERLFGFNAWCIYEIGAQIFNKKYDFKVFDRYNKEWCYIKIGDKYMKYRPEFKLAILISNSIGKIEIELKNNQDFKDITKNTYDKWKEIFINNK